MRNLLAATASLAILAAAGAAQAQPADWAGPYVGVTIGHTDRNEDSNETIRFDTDLNGDFNDTVMTPTNPNAFSPGFCGGLFNTNAAPGGCRSDDDTDLEWTVRAGYDFQFGSWVAGVVGEYGQLQLQDAVTAFSTTPAAYTFTRKLTDLWAVRARGGYAFGPALVYATGGYAQGNMKHNFITTNTVNAFPRSGGGDAKGWQLGFGGEYQFTPNVSVGLEWLRTSLDDDDFGVRASSTGTTPATNPFLIRNAQGTGFLRSDDDFEFDSFKAVLNWRF